MDRNALLIDLALIFAVLSVATALGAATGT